MIGRTLAHYRVTAAIGAGGMGEVYRATDTHLRRDVAIKVLPPEVARDEERLSRFRREAHLLAALNHPNIAAIYGLEEADGTPFLALELVEGEDLKQRLARGPIPVLEAMEIGQQIAEALEEAHAKGIVHRDLKPANVKLTPDGKVKVLDFGLAKAWSGPTDSSPTPGLSLSPTIQRSGTMAGVILGTAAYMSPEQARGRLVDRRTDVWAFGVLLWEMLTGRTLFVGDTLTDVIAGVVTRDPDLDALPSDTPAPVRRLVGRCLRKDPRTRLPDIGAARLELQDAIAGVTVNDPPPSRDDAATTRGEARRRTRGRWAVTAIALLAAIAGTLAFMYLRHPAEPGVAVRFAVDPPQGWSLGGFGWPGPSPNGRQIAFLARRDAADGSADATMIWIRSLQSLDARPLAGTEGAHEGVPAWSPDGGFIVFFAGGEVRTINLADGTVRRLCAMPSPGNGGADWNDRGTILFSAGGDSGRIYSVAATGGEARPVTALDTARGETSHHVPQFLPDGRRFLFMVAAGQQNSGVYVASLDAPSRRQKVAEGWVRYAYAAGHLLYARDGTLFAQPFDSETAGRGGEPVPIASSVAAWSRIPTMGWFGVSAGTVALFSGQGAGGQVQLTWMDRKGQQIATLGAPGSYRQVTLSPDGTRVALEVLDLGNQGGADLWVMDVTRGVASRVTATREYESDPVWAPDGRTLAFAREGKLRTKGLRLNDSETFLAGVPDAESYPENWSPDGRTILVAARTSKAVTVWALPVNGDGTPVAVLNTGFDEDEPQISPDGRWLAYLSKESGEYEVYVEPFRREGERVRVSVSGGWQPKWRGDGKELFYATPDSRLVAAAVRIVGDRLAVDPPAVLFTLPGGLSPIQDDYAPTADGQRFLVKVPLGWGRKPQLHVVTNWTSLLR